MKADLSLIKWLVCNSWTSRYRISKHTGIHITTLTNLAEGKSLIENLSFKNAAALTEYAEKIIKEDESMNTYLTPESFEFISDREPYPSDTGEFVHVIAWPKHLHQEDRYKLTFRANPNYNGYEDDPVDWCDWVAISAEYVGGYDARVIEETSELIKLNNGDVVRMSTWNGEKWYDNGKEYRPLYSYDYENNDTTFYGVEIK